MTFSTKSGAICQVYVFSTMKNNRNGNEQVQFYCPVASKHFFLFFYLVELEKSTAKNTYLNFRLHYTSEYINLLTLNMTNLKQFSTHS